MNHFSDVLLFLSAAVLAVPFFRRIGLGAILGYLCAGILIGPSAFRLISDVNSVMEISELGVVMLLFVIGLELQPSRLWVLRRQVFGLGSAQVGVTTWVLGGVAWLCGLSWQGAVVVGAGLAMSSTAFVLQTLAERNELTARHGRDSFAILLFQDLSVIPLMAAIPLLAPQLQGSAHGFDWLVLLKAVGAVAGLIVLGPRVLHFVFQRVAHTGVREVFTAAALLTVIGSASLLEWAGLSMSLGAFMAGVLLADSEYRHDIEATVDPFKGLLLGLFFMSVGMGANLHRLWSEPLLILALAFGLMLVKFVVLVAIGRVTGCKGRSPMRLGVSLAAGGEFAFVLFALAGRAGLLEAAISERMVMAVTISMLLAPVAFMIYDAWAVRFPEKKEDRPFDVSDDGSVVIIAGFGRFGQIVGRVLASQRIPFTALEKSPDQVDFVRRFGNKVYYGDASRLTLLEAAGTARAKLFVLAIDQIEDSLKTAELVRRHFPRLPVYARARNRFHAYKLRDAGVKVLYRETFAASLEMSKDVLTGLGLSLERSAQVIGKFRALDESLLDRQYAVYQDESALIQSSQQAMAELRGLFEAGVETNEENNDAGQEI